MTLHISIIDYVSSFYCCFFFLYLYFLDAVLLLGIFLFYQSVTRSAFVQNMIVASLGFLFYSFWVPQIVRNVFRGCRRPLSHRYIFVMSITRLYVPLCKYFNVL